MSNDTLQPLGSTRPEFSYGAGPDGPTPRPSENPLVKGVIILVMLAVATMVLVTTRDGEEPTTVAASSIESAPLSPELVDEAATASTPSTSDDDEARPWLAPQAMELSNGGVAERLRQQALADDSTTTSQASTTTTAPPTTAPATRATAPKTSTTAAPTSTAIDEASTSSEPTTATTDVAATSEPTAPASTDPSATDTTDTTVAAAPATTVVPATTAAPVTTAAENGWVDAGHGVMVPPVLLAIRYCESRDNYQAANTSSSARGAYQFLTGSWSAYGHADRYGVNQAHLASNAQQDEAALITWQRDGTRPWNASKSCWSSRI